MQAARPVAAFAFHPRAQARQIGPVFYAGGMATKAAVNGFRALLRAESSGASRRLGRVTNRQPGAAFPRVPGHAMLEIPASDSAHRGDSLSARAKSPLEDCRELLAATPGSDLGG